MKYSPEQLRAAALALIEQNKASGQNVYFALTAEDLYELASSIERRQGNEVDRPSDTETLNEEKMDKNVD